MGSSQSWNTIDYGGSAVPELKLGYLRRRLLIAGVAPKHVTRVLKELRHHNADLEAAALTDGLTPEAAAIRAEQLLGDQELIIQEALARPELKSWSHRWAWAAYGLCPIVLLAVAVVAPFIAINALWSNLGEGMTAAEAASHIAGIGWFRALFESWIFLAKYVLPVVFAAGVCVFAARRDTQLIWPVVGVVLISILGFFLEAQVRWPEAPGELARFGFGVGYHEGELSSSRAFRLLVPATLSLVPYLWWRRREQAERQDC